MTFLISKKIDIIIRTPGVFIGNVVSNFLLMYTSGYSMKEIIELKYQGIKELKLYTEGLQSFKNHRYLEAAEKFIKAHDLNPQDYTFLENAGMALIKSEKYQEAIYYLDKVISDKNSKEGKSEFGLGVCYEKLNKKKMSCKYYNSSMKLNYKPAFVKFAKNCG